MMELFFLKEKFGYPTKGENKPGKEVKNHEQKTKGQPR
jgi:hypothetical protein